MEGTGESRERAERDRGCGRKMGTWRWMDEAGDVKRRPEIDGRGRRRKEV